MTKTRKFSFIIFGLLLALANFLFVGCGKPDYSKTSLICSDAQGEITSIDLAVGEEKYVDFTIINPASGMNDALVYSFSKPEIASIEEISKQNFSTKYKISGLKGGDVALTVTTIDGNKSAEIEINVKEYASSITATNEKLFVTKSLEFKPSVNHFDLGENTTETAMKFYFYGEKNGTDSLDENSLKFSLNDPNYANEFASVSLITKGEKEYLLFIDEEGTKYSILNNAIIDLAGNKHYRFVKIENEDTANFSNCKAVTSGDKFYFVAIYNGQGTENESVLSCEREFVVFEDIFVDSEVGYAYQQVNVDGSGNETINENVEGYAFSETVSFNSNWTATNSLTLVPSFTSRQNGANLYENYKVAYLKITTKTNSLMSVKVFAQDTTLLSGKVCKIIKDENSGTTDYYIEVSSSSGKNVNTFYNVEFFYEGYEKLSSSSVNFALKIPVEIKVIPQRLLVNQQNTTATGLYTFYNFYKEDMYGWQEFRLSVDPSDASSSVKIDLTNSADLQFRYKGQVYNSTSSLSGLVKGNNSSKYLLINDLDEPLYIKGIQGSESVEIKNLNLSLCFDVFGRSEEKLFNLRYKIVDGAKNINLDEKYADTLYIDVNETDKIDATGILTADASFSKLYFYHLSGDNVANFEPELSVCGENNELKFSIFNRNLIGEGTYLIRLDNGISKTIKVVAIEALKSVTTTTTNADNNLIGSEAMEIREGINYFVKNDLSSRTDKLDIQIVANGKSGSKAINDFRVEKDDQTLGFIGLSSVNKSQKSFDILLNGDNGAEDLTITVYGYKIVNFVRFNQLKTYKIHFVSFDFIEKLNITKTVEGGDDSVKGQEATNCNVYYNTQNENLRMVSFLASVNNKDGYLFYAVKEGETQPSWIEDKFKENYISWEYNKSVYYSSNNNPIIETNYGYFNMRTLTYTAKQNIENANSVTDTLLARVTQYGKTYSYSINIRFLKYEEVSNVTLTTATKEISISALKKEAYVVAFADNNKVANNPTLVAYFRNNSITIGQTTYEMFNLSVTESDNKFMFTITADSEFSKSAGGVDDLEMRAKLYIVAQDWLVDGILRADKVGQEICIDVQYENGTENNRYTLTSEEDFINFDFNAHYKIGTTIDVSSVSYLFPMQEFKGSIVGTNQYAEITGININRTVKIFENVNTVFGGMFYSIGNDAYIENVTFSGVINIGNEENGSQNKNMCVGLIAGENHGALRNISVKLSSSSIHMFSGDVGGIVGNNFGTIIQDYSFVSLTSKGVEPFKSYKTVVTTDKFEVIGYDQNLNLIEVTGGIISFGAVTGRNYGRIQKIDALKGQTFIGYTNYFVNANLCATKHTTTYGTNKVYSISQFKVGGVAGLNAENSTIAGYVASKDPTSGTTTFVTYKNYTDKIKDLNDEEISFEAGKGLIVGGQITSNGYEGTKNNFVHSGEQGYGDLIGGIAGQTNKIGSFMTGLTSRMFLRSDGNVAGITNSGDADQGYSAYALQAVENGETGENASLIIIDRTSLPLNSDENDDTFNDFNIKYNSILFGEYTNTTFFDDGTLSKEGAFATFLTRNRVDKVNDLGEGEITSISINEYFGDYIVIGKQNAVNQNQKLKYAYFKLDTSKISVEYGIGDETLNNYMNDKDAGQNKAFYAYYFDVSSVAEGINRSEIQNELDRLFNKLPQNHKFYPIKALGELTLTSLTPEVITIDRDGTMTVKSTGIATITATSILNESNKLVIYVYVVNYFNSLLNESIVYPTQSNESTKIEQSEISIIANNLTNLFVLPDYTLKLDAENTDLALNKNGEGLLNNVKISLKSNDAVTAQVAVTNDNGKSNLVKIEIVGNQITISKGNEIVEDTNYILEISPILKFVVGEGNNRKEFTGKVNKTLSSVTAKYTKGAISINNIVFDEVTFYSSTKIHDTIIIATTASEADEGIDLEIFDENKTAFNNNLFDVSIKYLSKVCENGINYLRYSVEIAVNTNSSLFGSTDSIYQTYRFTFNAKSNNQIKLCLPVTLEKTSVRTISVTNYRDQTSLSSSDIINPGQLGHMAITLAPIDGVFDYILIENADANYLAGRASAVFGLSAKNLNSTGGDSIFDDGQILGSRTNKGLKLTKEEIIKLYSTCDNEGYNKYETFNGSIYINYIFSTNNVDNDTVSTVVISAYKDGMATSVTKPLTVKLPYYAKVSIANKELDGDHFAVARGLEYKLDIETYGYDKDLVTISSNNTTLGTIEKRNNDYYLKITPNKVSYANNGNKFIVTLRTNDEDRVEFVDEMNVQVQEYVVSYDGIKDKNKDVVSGMGDGVINVQIGSAFKLEIDLYDYVEFDANDVEIASKVKSFMDSMVKSGVWTARTNLNSSGSAPESGKTQDEGLEVVLGAGESHNYYFKYNNYKLTPIKTHEPIEKGYYITYTGAFEVNNGIYRAIKSKDAQNEKAIVETQFALNVYTSSSDQSPIPIFEYRDLLKMTDGGYYILLNNIVIPNTEETIVETGEVIPAFSPITTKFASLDGNGLSLIFKNGKYDVGSATMIAPFASLARGSVIKNLTISYQSTDTSAELKANGIGTASRFTPALTYFETSASSFTFGGVVAENAGAITNCRVETLNDGYISVYAPNATSSVTADSYMGLIAGNNSGFITNSTVKCNVQAPFNIGGITGTNDGKISGCAFKEGVITNILSKTGAVAGISVTNRETGKILTSFVRGKQSKTSVISSKTDIKEKDGTTIGVDDTSIISSPYSASGFVYQNAGLISDCYTDINLKGIVSTEGGMGYKISGFVGQNGGQIRNSYSVSLLPSNRDSSSGFAETNKLEDKTGSFANCYYLSDKDNSINVDLKFLQFEGVEALSEAQFDPTSNNKFSEYAHKQSIENSSVWFYPNGTTTSDFVEYQVTGGDTAASDEAIKGKLVFIGEVTEKNIDFAKGRLELVNPNTQALSRRIFDAAVVNEETGDITYYYTDQEDSPERGSIHNPRLIYDAKSMEDEILSSTSRSGLNISNFRLVNDIDYTAFEGLSSLYTVTFAGTMEGNGMTVSNISLESNKALASAGLFAGVGYSQMRRGSIKNLNLEIERMNFSETTNVGGVAGVLRYGELHGITVKPYSSNGATVLGANFAGGIVGKAIISYEITDVYSEMSVSSAYIAFDQTVYNQTSTNERYFSYAGSIAGFLGTGSLYNARSGNVDSIVGGKAGFVYGGVGKDAYVNYTYLDVKSSATIKSNLFAGLIAGEVVGTLSHAYVSDNGTDNNIFDVTARIPYAVGGITGRLAGGVIDNAVIYQTLNVNNFNINESYIQVVGGLVGTVEAESASLSRIYDCISTADVFARQIASGAVGTVLTSLVVDSVAINAETINVAGQTATPIVGGIVAQNEAQTTITNSYCNADIKIRTSTSGIDSTVYASGLVGLNTGTLRLAYCYTTSIFDAEIYDSRAIGGLKNFATSPKAEGNGTISFNLTEHGGKDSNKPNVIANNVYYFGSNSDSFVEQASYITFRTKTKDADIDLHVNHYGQGIKDSGETLDDSASAALQGNRGIMNNLFINRYAFADKNNTYSGTEQLFYKKPDLKVIRVSDETREIGFTNNIDTWMFNSSDSTKLSKRDKDNFTLYETPQTGIKTFAQLKVYRDAERTVYDNIIRENGNMTGVDTEIYVNVFSGGQLNNKPTSFIEIWNFDTWNTFASLAIEKAENLVWLNKATLGK